MTDDDAGDDGDGGGGSSGLTRVSVDEATAAFRELREYSLGNLDVEHQDVHPIAGLIQDDNLRRALMFAAEVYDPPEDAVRAGRMPRDFWETKMAREAVRKVATEVATTAVHEGNLSQISFLTGLPSYKSDVSGLHAINQLVDWLVHSEQCKLIYMAALMGRGKTDLACTFLEVIADHFDRLERAEHVDDEVPVPEFAANFEVEAAGEHEVEELHTYDALLEWAERGDSSQERWFIFDEASTELTAQSGANAQKVADKMAPFVKKMRKMGVNMIVIGHDKGDVHVAIRSLADFVDKTGLKTASFYAGINQREPVGHLFSVEGIPQTSWSFETDDTADWSWSDGTEAEVELDPGMTDEEVRDEIAERGARLYLQTEDLTQQDVADALSTEDLKVSRSKISRTAQRIEREEQPT